MLTFRQHPLNMATTSIFILLYIFSIISDANGITHWFVTEDGRTQAQVDSYLDMRHPDDLVAWMKQYERNKVVHSLKEELIIQKERIDANEDKDTGLEKRFYKSDPDCQIAGKPLPEHDLYITTVLPLTNKGIKAHEHINFDAPPSKRPQLPDCTKVKKLEFTMHGFEHLEAIQQRENLTGTPELGLTKAIPQLDTDVYGDLIHQAMQKNNTSWVLFNMAAFFWRIKGDSFHVIECVRRALHYSPSIHKDIALISLANVLHRARYSKEAAIVVTAALEISRELNVNHFTLGNIFAVLGEYNKSVACYENTLRIQPDFEAAKNRMHAVLCHAKLEKALEAQHQSLQRTLSELKDYQKKHEYWQQERDKYISEQADPATKELSEAVYREIRYKENIRPIGEFCHIKLVRNKETYDCSLRNRPDAQYTKWRSRNPHIVKELEPWSIEDIHNALNRQNDSEYKPNIPEPTVDYAKPIKPPLYNGKTSKEPESDSLLFKDKDWPSKDECDRYVQKFPSWNEFPTTYLPPENKGFEVVALLNDAQGLNPEEEHPLPWYPPVCVTIEDIPEGKRAGDDIPAVKDRTKVLKLYDSSMKENLLKMIPISETYLTREATAEEVGQRILTALQEKIGPKWILYNLAGLYWRVIGNCYHGIECLRRSLQFVPPQYRDVPLVNLANILYKWGRVEDAIRVMKEALAVNDHEPTTHFFLGNLMSAKSNMTGAIWHFEEALNQDSKNTEIYATLRIVKCYQKFHQAKTSAAKTEVKEEACKHGTAAERESRIVCKNENGQEKCMVETRTRARKECNGVCTQSCVMPANKGSPCMGGNIPKCVPSEKLSEITEFYKKQGLCSGQECKIEHPNQRPHIKLEYHEGLIHQKLVFTSKDDIIVMDDDCVIFNDGTKTTGCEKKEYQPLEEQLAEFAKNVDELEKLLMKHEEQCKDDENCAKLPKSTSFTSSAKGEKSTPDDEKTDSKNNDEDDDDNLTFLKYNYEDDSYNDDSPSQISDDIQLKDDASQTIYGKVKYSTHNEAVDDDLPDVDTMMASKIPDPDDAKLPDTTVHIKDRKHLPWPKWEECKEQRRTNFQEFTSTWLSVTVKDINLADYLDFETRIKRNFIEPECATNFGASAHTLDHLEGISQRKHLKYSPELGLKKVLQELGKESQPTDVMATRIARALNETPDSWVLANLAALYWRVEGVAEKAVDCLRLALHHAPDDMKDITLVSLANILHKSGHLNDAVIVTNMALDISPHLVVIHFTMANIYAAKSNWEKSTMFYESTMSLQETFAPARARLRSIMCNKVLSNPHIFKKSRKTT
ncbi:unnamed protein product [Owenia fusiformis]|uniref:Tetratricopeptide repeat protein 17 n=1 Tax=Owenia fusiformis TaxID=6347 RepID=A0A8S4NZ83_OWEFU|nr:unnamed protein product [Owenia fusiformis]